MKKLISVQQAADLLGLSKSRVNKAVKAMGLGVMVGTSYGLTEKDIQAIRDRMGKRGRPSS